MAVQPPVVVAWSGEVGHVVRPDPQIGGLPALFSASGKPGDGSPVYSQLSEERQRRALLECRCGVCGKQIPKNAPAIVLIITANPELGGDIEEPLTCRECLSMPLRHCPRVREAIEMDNKASVALAMRSAGVRACVGTLVLRPHEAQTLTVPQLFELAGLDPNARMSHASRFRP